MSDIDDPAEHVAAEPAPLGFKIVLVAAAGYLVVRFVQMIAWMF